MPVLTRAAERDDAAEPSQRSAAKGAALVLVLLAAIFAIWVALTLAAPVRSMGGSRFYWVGPGTRPVPPQGISGAYQGSGPGKGVHRQTLRVGNLAFEFDWTDRH
jgi:hypothetical protein